MTLPLDVWTPVPLAWRFVCVGDVFYSAKTEDLWLVTEIEDREAAPLKVTVFHGADAYMVEMDPDTLVTVLVPVAERDANHACRKILGGELVERRSGT